VDTAGLPGCTESATRFSPPPPRSTVAAAASSIDVNSTVIFAGIGDVIGAVRALQANVMARVSE
jgi:hypothetical protein